MSKITNIPSELRNFFGKYNRPDAFEALSRLVEDLRLDQKLIGGAKRQNCRLTNMQILQILILMPFFCIKGFSHYTGSIFSRMLGGKKDLFYSYVANDWIDWRGVITSITRKLITAVTVRNDFRKSELPAVIIADDSDLPKTGRRMEGIGKIFSHVEQKCILGFKHLALCWSDGRTQFIVDASLHGEKGKTDGKEQGLTAKDRSVRYNRDRDENSPAAVRKAEYFRAKGEKLKEMVKDAIRMKIPFQYLLVDSWFVCAGLVDFVCRRHKKFHLLGMAKMGNTKYRTEDGREMTAKALIARAEKKKLVKPCRRYRCRYATVDVFLQNHRVRLFFCRRSGTEGWKVLLTTDTDLDFLRAYRIYAMRWSIEVAFADQKGLLGLADCSARDFSAQIAHVSLVILRYNLLAYVKRAQDYETMGQLFGDICCGVREATVVDKIWEIVLEVIAVVVEATGADEDKLMTQIIEDNKRLAALQAFAGAA